MKAPISWIFPLSLFLATARGSGQPIIIDTDLYSDVDDVAALTIANVLQNCGLADIKGIMINTPSKYGAPAASSLCTYFGNGDIPIAAIRPLTDDTFFDDWAFTLNEYASKIAYNWPGTLTNASLAPTPVELYRTVLAEAKNKSLHIISVGFLTNLADLLQSQPDHISPLGGPALVEAKVSELIVMGGSYPSGWEYNFGGSDPNSTAYVVSHWPKSVAVTYSGDQLGGNIYSGTRPLAYDSTSTEDSLPIAAYQWYVGRGSVKRQTWDPVTTLYGILGLSGFQKLGMQSLLKYGNVFGYNTITAANGTNAWVNDTKVRNQHWLELADGVTNTSMSWLIDNFLVHPPSLSSCLV